jgi:ethanolamine ammonia-lyase small subunit
MTKKSISSETNTEPLAILKQFTDARIALGRAGVSVPVKAHLEFQLAHALARDAVSMPLDFSALAQNLSAQYEKTMLLHSQARDHQDYLQRPDKGRLLDPGSVKKLASTSAQMPATDIAIVIADGLSSKAIEKHAKPVLDVLFPELQDCGYKLAPISLVQYGRVAIGDPIGEILHVRMSIVLIGERPGLSSPDSMGIYFTYQPKTGTVDAGRNCISNIHHQGLSYKNAVHKLLFLINEASRLKISGVHLKDATQTINRTGHKNFLLE